MVTLGTREHQSSRAGAIAEPMSSTRTVQLFVKLSDGRTRSFVTESGLAAKGGDGEWRRVHSTLHAVRRHVMREETSPKL